MNAKNGKIRAGIIGIGNPAAASLSRSKDCSVSLPGPPKGAV